MFVIVTGASKGIGFEVVKQFAATENITILAIARNKKLLDNLKKHSPDQIITLAGDIAKPSTLAKVAAIVKKQGGNVDVLINNAGTLISKPFQKIDLKDLHHVYNTNLFVPFLLSQKLIPFMGKKQRSHIVNISSMGGVQGSSKFAGLSAYSSSKGALNILTECIAEELSSKRISCNSLALGAVETEMLRKAFPGYKAPVTASQMAGFIVDFAMNAHRYINGKIIPVSLSTP